MGDQLNAICLQVVQSGGGGMSTCVVVVEQQAAGADFWTACTPSLKNLGQATVDVLHFDSHSTLTVFLSWSGTEAI